MSISGDESRIRRCVLFYKPRIVPQARRGKKKARGFSPLARTCVVPPDNVTWNTIETELAELYKILSTQKEYEFQQITAMV